METLFNTCLESIIRNAFHYDTTMNFTMMCNHTLLYQQ